MDNLLICKAKAISRESAIEAGCDLLPEGFPILIDANSGAVAHDPTLFLARLCLGGGSTEYFIVKPCTAMSRAYDLRDFLAYLTSRRVSFNQLTANTLFAYAATMANKVSPFTREIYSRITIARRVSVAVKFCGWLCDRNIVPPEARRGLLALREDLYGWQPGLRAGKNRARRSLRTTLLPTVAHQHEPHILSEAEVRNLLAAIRVDCGKQTKRSTALRLRNTLMTKLALCAGLRREEVCALKIAAIASISTKEDELRLFPVTLTKTKNDARRKVLVPSGLIRELQGFIAMERGALCGGTCKGRCGSDAPIFPSTRSSAIGRCLPMSPQNFGTVIRLAACRAGLVRDATRMDDRGKVVATITVPLLTTHDLRHTYAVWTYLLLRSDGDLNPWLFIQAQLGHASSETTINTYLRAVRMFENEISDVFVRYVRSLADMTD